MRSISNSIFLAPCFILLSACGGGGDSSDSSSQPVAVNQPPSLTLSATVSVMEGSTQVGTATGSDP